MDPVEQQLLEVVESTVSDLFPHPEGPEPYQTVVQLAGCWGASGVSDQWLVA